MGSEKRLLWSSPGRPTFGELVVIEVWFDRNVEPDKEYLFGDFLNAIEVSICLVDARGVFVLAETLDFRDHSGFIISVAPSRETRHMLCI